MAAEWTSLNKQVAYKEVITKLPDYWEDSLLKEGESTITYVEISCNHEKLGREDSEILPQGVRSTDARWLFTSERLNTHTDFETNVSKATKVYMSDPRNAISKPPAYVVWDVAEWEASSSFELIATEYDYIIIREGKL